MWWNSLEHFSLENKLTGHVLEGFIVGIMEKKPFNLHYRITCDSKWQTRQAEITTTHGQERKQLSVVVDQKNSVWYFGAREAEQNSYLSSLEAPNFTLPDLDGKLHSLADFRGRKVLLVTWASW